MPEAQMGYGIAPWMHRVSTGSVGETLRPSVFEKEKGLQDG